MGALEVPRRSEVSHAPALHKKSGQKSDSAVNKDFLVSFWRFFEIKKTHFGRKKHRQGTLFVQSRPRACWIDRAPGDRPKSRARWNSTSIAWSIKTPSSMAPALP